MNSGKPIGDDNATIARDVFCRDISTSVDLETVHLQAMEVLVRACGRGQVDLYGENETPVALVALRTSAARPSL